MFSVRRVELNDYDNVEKFIRDRGGVTHFGDEMKSVSRRVEESVLSVVTATGDYSKTRKDDLSLEQCTSENGGRRERNAISS